MNGIKLVLGKVLALAFILISVQANAQQTKGGIPPTFLLKETQTLPQESQIKMPVNFSISELLKEDEFNARAGGIPPRFAQIIPADIDIIKSGIWTVLPDGRRVCRIAVEAREAKAIIFSYSDFYLPAGSELFIYSADRRHVLGAYDNTSNSYGREFSTPLVAGDAAVFEYVSPDVETGDEPQIIISGVGYGYNYIRVEPKEDEIRPEVGESFQCQVNVICSEGDNWRHEIKSACKLLITDGSGWGYCSGTLMNTTANNESPYIATAMHCYGNASAANLNQWQFHFFYESTSCGSNTGYDGYQTLTGCTRKALIPLNGGSDGQLVLLNSSIPSAWVNGDIVTFAGWNRAYYTSGVPQSGVGIHHPLGDVKKILTYTSPASVLSGQVETEEGFTAPYSMFYVQPVATANGHSRTQGGSSGSGLFDHNGLFVGTLTGSNGADCSNLPNAPFSVYGALFYHWDRYGNTTADQMKTWLDPVGNGTAVTCPSYPNPNPLSSGVDFTGTPTTVNTGGTVSFNASSVSDADSVLWEFEYGSPSVSKISNPVVTYNTGGQFTVKLTKYGKGRNNAVVSYTEEKIGYVTVNKLNQTGFGFASSSQTITYGDSPIYTATGGQSAGTISYAVTAGTDVVLVNSGSGAVTTLKNGTATITATRAGDATYNDATAMLNLTVDKCTLTATAVATNRDYDGTVSVVVTVTPANVVGSDAVTLTADGTVADANAGIGKTVTISNIQLSGADAGKYNPPASIPNTTVDIYSAFWVDPVADQPYTGSQIRPAVVVKNDNSITLVENTDYTLGYGANINAGTAVGTVSITGINNYAGSVGGATFNIMKRDVTITGLGAADKIYDGTTTAAITGTATISGKISGDDLNAGMGVANFADPNAGNNKTVTFSGFSLTGTAAGNYNLTAQPASVTANITGIPVTITGLTVSNKIYDGTTVAEILEDGAISGAISGDDVDVVTGDASFDNKNAGNGKTVTFSNFSITGADAGKYSLTQPASVTADILKKDVTITGLGAADKPYDGTTAATITGTATISGKISGDDLNAGMGVANFADPNAGNNKTVMFSGFSLTGIAAVNYNLAAQPANVTANIIQGLQTITFNPAAILTVEDETCTLAASTENGVTVKFRIDGSTDAANLNAAVNTLLHLIQTGSVTVTAYIDDVNYSASEVSRTIIIASNNAELYGIYVNDNPADGFFLADCGTGEVEILISPEEAGAKVLYNGTEVSDYMIYLDISRPDVYTVNYEIEASAGNRKQYTLQIESMFDFDEIAGMKFNNLLFVNDNTATNGGYDFVDFEWFRNGQSIGNGQYYSAGGNRGNLLDASAQYSIAMTTSDGKILHTCPFEITLQAASLHAYPNPLRRGELLTLEYTAPLNLNNVIVRIYNLSGKLISTQKLTDSKTKISLPDDAGLYLITVNNETVKIIVE